MKKMIDMLMKAIPVMLLLAAGCTIMAQEYTTRTEATIAAANLYNTLHQESPKCKMPDTSQVVSLRRNGHSLIHEVHVDGMKILVSGVKSCVPILAYQYDLSSEPLLGDDSTGMSYFIEKYCYEINHAIDSGREKGSVLPEWNAILEGNLPSNKANMTNTLRNVMLWRNYYMKSDPLSAHLIVTTQILFGGHLPTSILPSAGYPVITYIIQMLELFARGVPQALNGLKIYVKS